jgi:large subunit ribosomal protein L21
MFAVLKTGGKQYKVSKNDVIIVEKLTASAGDIVQFDQVLMISDNKVQVGTPVISGAAVHAEIIEQTKNKKVTSFVKRRRKHSSQRTRGHRQNVTVLRINDILISGAKVAGAQIEFGAMVVGSNPKVTENGAVAKKPVTKVKAAKKSVAKPEAPKDPVAKAEETKKPAAKVKAPKKPVAKAVETKKPAAKLKAPKKPVAKKSIATKSTKS